MYTLFIITNVIVYAYAPVNSDIIIMYNLVCIHIFNQLFTKILCHPSGTSPLDVRPNVVGMLYKYG